MLCSCVIGIYILIFEEKTCFKILGSINKGLIRLALISTITKWQKQSSCIYDKNMNGDSDVYLRQTIDANKVGINSLSINIETPTNLKLID